MEMVKIYYKEKDPSWVKYSSALGISENYVNKISPTRKLYI